VQLLQQDDLNFLLTNRIPRRLLTRFMGWFSKIEQPLIRDVSIALWRFFCDLNLAEAKETSFKSMHACFIRELKPGARIINPDPAVLVSPCDAIVGACGKVAGTRLYQIKGFPYTLDDLFCDPDRVEAHRDGRFVTLRLTAGMYHRFHAPHDCQVEGVTYISGDTWNVNPIALARIEKLFCKNERAVVRMRLAQGGHQVTLVPVAAILVASIKLHCLDRVLNLAYRGPNRFGCDANYRKGDEMGWFEHGSTIIVFVPDGFELADHLCEGASIRVGDPLFRLP
jgi:phosphatidylserine decarboxylase